MRDIGGTLIIQKGLIQRNHYMNDYVISSGIIGIKNGDINGWCPELTGNNYAVVKTECDLIVLDELHNIVKFECGYVLLVGSKEACIRRIQELNSPEKKTEIYKIENTN
jgi:hypothetical protein